MEFKTSISKMTEKDHIIRGEKLSGLVDGSFSDAIFLILRGKKPSKQESRIFEAMLTLSIDHGMGTSSSLTSRFVGSTGNTINVAVGAGVLALGNHHGGAIEKAMEQLSDVDDVGSFVEKSLKEKNVIYGFGHKIYKEEDPRVTQLLDICKKEKFSSMFVDEALAIEKKIEEKKGKKICLNVDGFMAAVLLEMGFSAEAGRGVFIVARVPGLLAQAVEEKENEKPVRRVAEEDIVYDGD
ncbi:MAG: citryl-CoA lyase [Candidatus Woesearchaeota archaeon]|jgi:citryl-CoA lyase|nr:citryl-CoA lyase [Candidatus Woesearchaeota archaeon]MDP7324453.1 citryl-CoA lyase [Candidatus Woesearchaeota archaeon]MDP7457117.1 citryl-CoA lyase [Candidatus Woesearchaeota archaeon]